jgi:predicted GNAT family N-acyltransferase
MALKIIEHNSPEYDKMVSLRFDILRKPLGLEFSKDELDREADDILIGAFDDDRILACCMLTSVATDRCRLRQMAVHNSLQGKGIGAAMMNFAENIARDRGYKTLTMHARKSAVGFYEKFGYKICGEEFQEVTIPHFEMQKRLAH